VIMDSTEFTLQNFESAAHGNETRYWHAHEFMSSLGYETWDSFVKVINRAMSSCAQLGIQIPDAFMPHSYADETGKARSTYRLTRFACLLTAMHADDKKPQVAKAKAALAAVAEALIEQTIQQDDVLRIDTREDLKLGEKIMTSAAQDAGLDSGQFGLFKDAGFRGMYNMGLGQLRVVKGVPEKKTLYDYMGLTELAGNLFRVTQTAERIKNQQVSGLRPLSTTAETVGREVRHMMQRNSGVSPEDIPITEDIASVQKRLKTTNRAMLKHDKSLPIKKA
jgi:DNA-damage-inducible protein D